MTIQWPLIFFTLFVSMSAGVLFTLGLLGVLGKDKEVRFPAMWAAFGAIVVGGICSVFHLEHVERIFNGFGQITSGITQELIFIIIAVAALVLYFAMARKGETPKWVGIVAVAAGLLLAFFVAHSYSMAARPAWDNFWMYAFYVGGAFLLGTLTVLGLQGFTGAKTGFVAKLAVIAGVLQTIIVVAYGFFASSLAGQFTTVGNYFDSTVPTQGMKDPSLIFGNLLSGENALLFWGGAVVLGALIPLVMGLLGLKKEGKTAGTMAFIGVACALVGGIAFRVILYNLGTSTYFLF